MKQKFARDLISQFGLVAGCFSIGASIALAQSISVDIFRISETGIGEKIGSVVLEEGKPGLTMRVSITGLPTGSRGFHLHANGDCRPGMDEGKMAAGMAAGEHFDPDFDQVAQRAKQQRAQGRSSGIAGHGQRN